jgi:TolB-like protein/Tfp pilus assembly protein PilF
LVSREEIAERLWGKDVFVDIDHSINTAIRKIRLALRDDPEKPRFVETVVGKGYRFAAPVICNNGDSTPEVQPLPLPVQVTPVPAAHPKEARHVSARPWMMLPGVVVLALIAVTLVLYRVRSAKATGQPAIKSLAVLPLKNLSGDPAQEYLADGMTEELIGRLSGIRNLKVISRTSAMQFKDTHMSAPEIAKALHVDALVEGSVIREGNRIRVHAQLIRGATDEHFWSEEYDRQLQDVLALQSDVAQAIAEKVEVALTGQERAQLVSARPVSPEVYESYLKGMQLVDGNSKAEIEESITYFEGAAKKDPTFAQAYVGLAEAYDRLGYTFVGVPPSEVRPKVMSAAQKAIALDPKLAEAHVMLADVYQVRWQWREAETEYRRALELSPNDADAHAGYANWLLCQGRIDEAVAWSRSGGELQPLDPDAWVSWILFNARRYDEAIPEVRSVLAVHPDSAMAHWVLGFALIGKGQSEDAIPVLEKTVSMTDRSPGAVGLLATAYARAGHRTEALRLLEELKLRRQKGYIPAGAFIFPYLALGDYEEAFVWFERAYQEQSNILQFLKVHPFFDPVRNDPRFADLVRRVGLH